MQLNRQGIKWLTKKYSAVCKNNKTISHSSKVTVSRLRAVLSKQYSRYFSDGYCKVK